MPTHTLAEMTPDARRTLRRHLLTIQDLAAALLQLDDLTPIADHLDTLEDRAYNAALPLTDALKLIRNARDYFAEHGEYQPDAGPDGDQQFDDWAADLADRALAVCVFDATDRIQHMFWRDIDPGHPAGRGREQAPHRDVTLPHWEDRVHLGEGEE